VIISKAAEVGIMYLEGNGRDTVHCYLAAPVFAYLGASLYYFDVVALVTHFTGRRHPLRWGSQARANRVLEEGGGNLHPPPAARVVKVLIATDAEGCEGAVMYPAMDSDAGAA
jgi:hypothetical protein